MPKTKKIPTATSLATLLPEQQRRLMEWLAVDRLSCAGARARLKREFGVTVSLDALQSYYARSVALEDSSPESDDPETPAPSLEDRFHTVVRTLAEHLMAAATNPEKPDPASARLLAKLLADTGSLSLAERELALEERQLMRLEAEAAREEGVQSTAESSSTAAQQHAERMRILLALN
ncbi:MAG TPA: hypothetical protein VGE76_12500 [Opitutaceae bacterium]